MKRGFLCAMILVLLSAPEAKGHASETAEDRCADARLEQVAPLGGLCNEDSTCPYNCCRQPFDSSYPCYCSACCTGSKDKLKERKAALRDCPNDPKACQRAQAVLLGLLEDHLRSGKRTKARAYCLELMQLRARHPELSRSGGGEERPEVYWSGPAIALVFRHRVEFYEVPNGIAAYLAESGILRRLSETEPASGPIRFYRDDKVRVVGSNLVFKVYKGEGASRLEPKKIVTFREAVGWFPHKLAHRSSFLLCTDQGLEPVQPQGDKESFCGAYDVMGNVLFEVPRTTNGLTTAEPLGLSDDGKEALFALNEVAHGAQARTVKEYLIWREPGGFETIPVQPMTDRLKKLLRKYVEELYFPVE